MTKLELEVQWVEGGNLDERLYESVVDAIATRIIGKPRFEIDDDVSSYNFGAHPNGTDLESRARREIASVVRARAEELADKLVTAEVERLIREGWETTDTYGRPKATVTVADVVRAQLAKEAPRGYNDPKELVTERLAKVVVEEVLRTEFKAELASIKEKFRAEVDGVLRSKLVETLRETLGLGR